MPQDTGYTCHSLVNYYPAVLLVHSYNSTLHPASDRGPAGRLRYSIRPRKCRLLPWCSSHSSLVQEEWGTHAFRNRFQLALGKMDHKSDMQLVWPISLPEAPVHLEQYMPLGPSEK